MSANDLAANHWTALAAQQQSLSFDPFKEVPKIPEDGGRPYSGDGL
jgi:hypothetical protein